MCTFSLEKEKKTEKEKSEWLIGQVKIVCIHLVIEQSMLDIQLRQLEVKLLFEFQNKKKKVNLYE